jgi:cytochrome c
MGWVLRFALAFVVSWEASAAELHDAARRGDLAAVERLLAGGVRVDAVDGNGATPLYVAASEGHSALVIRLLKAGGDPRQRAMGPFGSTGAPIHVAAREGHLEVVRVLLEAGVDPGQPDDAAGPPLHGALRRGQTAVAEMLRSFGARPVRAKSVDARIATADPAAGRETAYACAVCHELTKLPEQARQGPPLWGIFDRPKAGFPGFEYSEALRTLGGRWSYQDLDSYIADPRSFAPGTRMEFRGISEPARRAALIAFLRSLSDAPKPLR